MRFFRKVVLVLLATVLIAMNSAHAIITRHDLPDSDYLVADAEYPALVDLVSRGDCIATVVHEYYLISVAHCAEDVYVGKSLNINGSEHAVAEVLIYPQWSDSKNENDISLIRLALPVKGVVPLPIYRGDRELNSLVTLIGRGVHATGLVGEGGATDDYILRRATNRVSAVNNFFLEFVFERPGDVGITSLEGVGAAGDSGGPSLIDVSGVPHIVGLNSWGKGEGGGEIGQYGSKDYQTRVSQYLDWLDLYLN